MHEEALGSLRWGAGTSPLCISQASICTSTIVGVSQCMVMFWLIVHLSSRLRPSHRSDIMPHPGRGPSKCLLVQGMSAWKNLKKQCHGDVASVLIQEKNIIIRNVGISSSIISSLSWKYLRPENWIAILYSIQCNRMSFKLPFNSGHKAASPFIMKGSWLLRKTKIHRLKIPEENYLCRSISFRSLAYCLFSYAFIHFWHFLSCPEEGFLQTVSG